MLLLRGDRIYCLSTRVTSAFLSFFSDTQSFRKNVGNCSSNTDILHKPFNFSWLGFLQNFLILELETSKETLGHLTKRNRFKTNFRNSLLERSTINEIILDDNYFKNIEYIKEHVLIFICSILKISDLNRFAEFSTTAPDPDKKISSITWWSTFRKTFQFLRNPS